MKKKQYKLDLIKISSFIIHKDLHRILGGGESDAPCEEHTVAPGCTAVDDAMTDPETQAHSDQCTANYGRG